MPTSIRLFAAVVLRRLGHSSRIDRASGEGVLRLDRRGVHASRAAMRRAVVPPPLRGRSSSCGGYDERRARAGSSRCQLTCVDRFRVFPRQAVPGQEAVQHRGGEATIPLLKFLTERAGELGAQEIILGVALRRPSLRRSSPSSPRISGQLFAEFKDAWVEGAASGRASSSHRRAPFGRSAVAHRRRCAPFLVLNNRAHPGEPGCARSWAALSGQAGFGRRRGQALGAFAAHSR